MGTIEQAAKRLEELRKAGAQVSGDLAYPAPHSEAAPSLIERAVRKLESLDEKGVASIDAPSITQADEAATRRPESSVATLARREPTLTHAVPRTPPPASRTFRSRGEAAKGERLELDLPDLAARGYLTPDDPESALANEFRRIKRPLIQACQGKLAAPVENANRIMVTSSVPGEGKTFVAFNLAVSIAMERDSTVLFIDADTTQRSASRLVGADSNFGLLDVLAGERVEVSDILMPTSIERLVLLPAGGRRWHATELLASDTMERLVQQLASQYTDRILIFDAPPLLVAPEPAVLASYMGQIVVVVEANKTTHKVLTNALSAIRACPVVSTVLNKATGADQGYSYSAD